MKLYWDNERGWKVTSCALAFLVIATANAALANPAGRSSDQSFCDLRPYLCTEKEQNYDKSYIGHDEPALLFYSSVPGSGNSNFYTFVLPKDPPVPPKQNGTGGTFNFQLHPAFWFGMAMCDTQSYPEFTSTCTPDSDTNIFDNPSPASAAYVGHHPGTAFMEMQFYPPGWAPFSCDAKHWCAALTIDSFSFDPNHGNNNNNDCLNKVGEEPINFAFITKSGVADTPADPQNIAQQVFKPATDLVMNPGDTVTVQMNDTAGGFKVLIRDLTTGHNGSMTASLANGFKQVLFRPKDASCTSRSYAFHPMYSTSSEHTRVVWAAHTYNIAFADEIGHFEYCNAIDSNGACVAAGVSDPHGLDADDTSCFAPSSPSVPIIGCTNTEGDFDGVCYRSVWPGTNPNVNVDETLHPAPIVFSSPRFQTAKGLANYSRVGFETDLPRIETGVGCNRTTGAGCVNPPPGAAFYPLFTANRREGQCVWQLGGVHIPGTVANFGGTSTLEFGPLLAVTYPSSPQPVKRFNDFRKILTNNPCPAATPTATPTRKPTPTPTRKPTATPTRKPAH